MSGTVVRFYDCHAGPNVIRDRLEVLDRYIPKVDYKFRDFDLLAKTNKQVIGNPFTYLSKYLNVMREVSLVALLRLPLDLAFTELRTWLEEKGLDKEIDNQTLLNGIDAWLHAKRLNLT